MTWDLGLRGLALLVAMSVGFGGIAQLVAGRATTPRLWAVAAGAYFVVGIVVSEVLFGWATQEELQPNIDGLSFDEVLLLGFVGVAAVLVVRYVALRRSRRSTDRAVGRSTAGGSRPAP